LHQRRVAEVDLPNRLHASARFLPAKIHRHYVPTLVAKLLQEREPALQPALLILEPGTTTRFEVAVLLTRKHKRHIWLGPINSLILQDLAVDLDRIYLFALRMPRIRSLATISRWRTAQNPDSEWNREQ